MLLQINGATISCEIEELKSVPVATAYLQEDEHFFRSIHKKGGTMQECILDTLGSIDPASVMYVIKVDGNFAAFFVKAAVNGMSGMEGFHILKRYRHRWFTEIFWKIVRSIFKEDFFTALYERNTPAINHLQSIGFKVVRHFYLNGQNYLLFVLQF